MTLTPSTSTSPSNSASRIEESRLTVLLDLRHPLAYLALHPTIDFAPFAREAGVDINWLPVRIPALRSPSSPGAEDDRGVRHRRHRANAIAREIEVYGAAQGLVLREFYRDPDPVAAFSAWLWMREHLGERLTDFLAELFRAYWALELDPSDAPAVARLVEGVGGSGAAFLESHQETGAARVEALAEELSDRGLAGAPLYRLDDEVFVGRQHLPMLRWILEGRSGPGPI